MVHESVGGDWLLVDVGAWVRCPDRRDHSIRLGARAHLPRGTRSRSQVDGGRRLQVTGQRCDVNGAAVGRRVRSLVGDRQDGRGVHSVHGSVHGSVQRRSDGDGGGHAGPRVHTPRGGRPRADAPRRHGGGGPRVDAPCGGAVAQAGDDGSLSADGQRQYDYSECELVVGKGVDRDVNTTRKTVQMPRSDQHTFILSAVWGWVVLGWLWCWWLYVCDGGHTIVL